jgi:glycerol-3-phosphate dehydrogenase
MPFATASRPAIWRQINQEAYDLLVIGGGVTGCGIALDAAMRGLRVVLIERGDYASGTSSRSTKLIHGGLRYLKQLEIKLVHDVSRERTIVHSLARHIVIPEPMLLPIIKGGSLGKQTTAIALWVYDFLADVKASEHRQMLDKTQTLDHEPMLHPDLVEGGGLYYEYRTDDSRLVIELAKTAASLDVHLMSYAAVTALRYDDAGSVIGAIVRDTYTGSEISISARITVNAAGPYVDSLRQLDQSLTTKHLRLTKGVHIVLQHERLPIKQSVYFDMPDGRMVFAIPRDGITYIGTTDTVYEGDIAQPEASLADVDYLLAGINHIFPSCRATIADVISSWAGLRPLIYEEGKSPSELSRHDEIMTSPSGMISIAGGKLTGYRLMAEQVVDLVTTRLPDSQLLRCTTREHRLIGGAFETDEAFSAYVHNVTSQPDTHGIIPIAIVTRWLYRYGSETPRVLAIARELATTYLEPNQCALAAEITYCLEHEMCMTESDFAVRRTGMIYFDKARLDAHAAFISSFFSTILGRTSSEAERALALFTQEIQAVTIFK